MSDQPVTRPTVAEACARAVEAWGKQPGAPECFACMTAWEAIGRAPMDLVTLWAAEETDLSCAACHAMMTELSKLADPAGALALAVGREGRAVN